jgi:Tfp pilus assembly protein PilN
MKHQDKHHKIFLSYLFVVIGLFILALLAYPFYQESIIKSEERSLLQLEYTKKSDRLKELQRIHSLIQEQDSEIFQRIKHLSQDIIQDDILEYIHDYTRSLP